MDKRGAILKLEYIEWAFERHIESKNRDSDLKPTEEFMALLKERIAELVSAIQRI
jgi:hypothetical protein